MEFQLPQNLLKQVVAYDPILKPIYQKIEQANKPARASSGPRLSLGIIDCLLPVDLVSAEQQIQITTDINAQKSISRAIRTNNEKCEAVVVHHASMWYCWWFVKPEYKAANSEFAKQHEYLYGCSIAFKNTSASLNRSDLKSSTLGWNDGTNNPIRFAEIATRSERKTGRCKWILKTALITERIITKGATNIPFIDEFRGYTRKMRHEHNITTDWMAHFKATIPSWKDASLFDRMKEAGDVRKCVFTPSIVEANYAETSFADILVAKAMDARRMDDEAFIRLHDLMKTPFFRKEANKTFDDTLKIYTNPETTSRQQVLTPTELFKHRLSILRSFVLIFGATATADHCQQLWAMAGNISSLRTPAFASVCGWLEQNMPVSSFIQIITKKVVDEADEYKREYNRDYRTGMYRVTLHELNDTLSMIDQVYRAQHGSQDHQELKLARPNRWRINEFHDYLQAECFKLTTPNEKLPQDFFPEPIRIEKDGQRWSFFQPCDVHQLGSWGKAVRNCVGSADSYRKGIKNKTHMIFLVMLDSQPRYTVQAKIRNGVLHIEQIADVCNRTLNSEQRSMYEQTFTEAINIRISQLPQQQPENLEFAQ